MKLKKRDKARKMQNLFCLQEKRQFLSVDTDTFKKFNENVVMCIHLLSIYFGSSFILMPTFTACCEEGR